LAKGDRGGFSLKGIKGTKGDTVNRTRIGVSMIFFFLAALALILCGSPPSTAAGSTYTIARTVQYSFTVENGTDRLLKKGEFWTYGPVKRTATQRCVKVESSHRHELIVDDLGNQVLHFTVQDLTFSSPTRRIRSPPRTSSVFSGLKSMSRATTPRSPGLRRDSGPRSRSRLRRRSSAGSRRASGTRATSGTSGGRSMR
jgi:hypothetical protein